VQEKFSGVRSEFSSLISLAGEALFKAREKSTCKQYSCYFQKWSNWRNQYEEISETPAQEQYIIIYLLSLLQKGKSFPVIKSSLFAIKYYHSIEGLPDPFTSALSNLIYEGIKRICSHQAKKKLPIKIKHLKNMFNILGGNKMDLKNLRTMVISILSFMGFLRFSEVIKIRRSDILIFSSHIQIFIEKSKTDVYREGHWLHIATLNSELCPAKLLNRLFMLGNIKNNCEKFIFRELTHSSSLKLRNLDKHISYTTVRDNILKLLNSIGLNQKLYGLHSLRSGGATAAANLGVPDRLFKKHGRWKSENVKDGYVHENLQSLLSVTNNLGL